MYAKVDWKFYEEHDLVLSQYGSGEAKVKTISKIPDFIRLCYEDKARQNSKETTAIPKGFLCQLLQKGKRVVVENSL